MSPLNFRKSDTESAEHASQNGEETEDKANKENGDDVENAKDEADSKANNKKGADGKVMSRVSSLFAAVRKNVQRKDNKDNAEDKKVNKILLCSL